MIKIATWNVNSVNARLEHLLKWLERASPGILLLQEIKCPEEKFPSLEISALGYQAIVAGQKSYNGVAVLSRLPMVVELEALPGDETDLQARFLQVKCAGLRLASIYLPNGNPVGADKFAYKLSWMERLYAHAKRLLEMPEPLALGGDFNVIPENIDVYDPQAFASDALFQPESRAALRKIMNLGFTDAFLAASLAATKDGGRYTWWSYRNGAFPNDHGVRIDFLLLSPAAADRLDSCCIDREPRGWEKPSDHAPLWCRLKA